MYYPLPQAAAEPSHEDWPQGFDIRAERAEQQEMLQEASVLELNTERTVNQERAA